MPPNGRRARQEQGKALILNAARGLYRSGQRMEITALAAEYGISRASAYRWFGNNERLLAEVIAELIRDNFHAQLIANANNVGRQRVLSVIDGFLRYAIASDHFETLLRRDPNRTLKLVASSAHHVQQTTIQLVEDLLNEKRVAQYIFFAVPAHTLAYTIVRLLEAYLYADVLTGEQRDIDAVVQLIGMLIPERSPGGADHARRRRDRRPQPIASTERVRREFSSPRRMGSAS